MVNHTLNTRNNTQDLTLPAVFNVGNKNSVSYSFGKEMFAAGAIITTIIGMGWHQISVIENETKQIGVIQNEIKHLIKNDQAFDSLFKDFDHKLDLINNELIKLDVRFEAMHRDVDIVKSDLKTLNNKHNEKRGTND